jgi:hypothetical protein
MTISLKAKPNDKGLALWPEDQSSGPPGRRESSTRCSHSCSNIRRSAW